MSPAESEYGELGSPLKFRPISVLFIFWQIWTRETEEGKEAFAGTWNVKAFEPEDRGDRWVYSFGFVRIKKEDE